MSRLKLFQSQVKGSVFHDLYHSLKVQYTYKLSNNRVSIFTLKFISTVGACDVIEDDVIELKMMSVHQMMSLKPMSLKRMSLKINCPPCQALHTNPISKLIGFPYYNLFHS